jgi:hypothetical protein
MCSNNDLKSFLHECCNQDGGSTGVSKPGRGEALLGQKMYFQSPGGQRSRNRKLRGPGPNKASIVGNTNVILVHCCVLGHSCSNLIQGYCCVLDHSWINVRPNHFCSTMFSNCNFRSFRLQPHRLVSIPPHKFVRPPCWYY